MGIRKVAGHKTDHYTYIPTPVNLDKLNGAKVVDWDIGLNTMVLLTENNEVYFSGLDIVYMPVHWSNLNINGKLKIKKVVATQDSFAAVTEDNKIYSFNDLFVESERNFDKELFVADNSLFGNGNIVDIGGSYGLRYAIVN